jgi:hypothetical protein
MNQYSILQMARESGLLRGGDGWTEPHRWGITELEQFAKAIENHLRYDSIHTCHAECQRPACVAVREAVKAEREACAKVFDGEVWSYDYREIAAAIRARGEK